MDGRARYLKNEFSDYKGKPIDGGIYKKIQNQALNLLGALENNYVPDNDFSVYTGTAGIAYMYLQLYMKMEGDPERSNYLQKAKRMIELSLRHMHGGNVTFLCGNAGPFALGAVIFRHCGMVADFQKCVSELKKLSKLVLAKHSLPDELLYGRVGYLYALLFVNSHMDQAIEDSLIQQVSEEVVQRGVEYSKKRRHGLPMLYDWYNEIYLGAAHGIIGILYLLMLSGANDKHQSLLVSLLDHLMTLVFPSGNYPAALEANATDELVHWCHGAPGWVFTFVKAFQLYKAPKYLEAARGCAEVVWQRGLLKKGYGICHGVAGNAYTFLSLYKATNEEMYLHRALKFSEFIFDYGSHGCRKPDTPFSLFEGMAGTIYFLADMLGTPQAKFPAYEL